MANILADKAAKLHLGLKLIDLDQDTAVTLHDLDLNSERFKTGAAAAYKTMHKATINETISAIVNTIPVAKEEVPLSRS